DKRLAPDVLALGASGLAVAVMVITLTKSARNNSAARKAVHPAHKVLANVLGADVADDLVTEALNQLEHAVQTLLVQEEVRYLDLIDTPEAVQAAQTALREAARQAEY